MEIISGSTDEKIIQAAFRLIQKDGLDKATTKKIAAEAGVNEVTIFRKFETKGNLMEIVKKYYLDLLIGKLEDIFNFEGDEEIDAYLKNSFYGIFNLSDEDFSIIKVSMEEVNEVPEKKRLISQITDVILNKLEEFFIFKMENGSIKKVNPKVLSVMCFSIIFQSVILWNIYDREIDVETEQYADEVLNILFEGINH